MKNEEKVVEVFSGELWKATMIKTMLDDNCIPAFLNNEYLGAVAPYMVDAGGMPDVKVIVESKQQEEALKLINEFNNSKPVTDNDKG